MIHSTMESSVSTVTNTCTCIYLQVIRSAEESSTGKAKEASIHEAYLQTIRNAEYFIYIEVNSFT